MRVALRFAVVAVCFVSLISDARSADTRTTRIDAVIDQLIKSGSVAGAQLAVGEADSPLVLKNFGVRDVNGRKPVDNDTQFCIGSCSKMFAGAVLVSLAAEKTVDLDVPIDRWLKDFAASNLAGGGTASRAPTLKELLCHRGGVYSQRDRLTKRQTRWIRDFQLSLADSVAGIAREPLSIDPGKRFAYSGAGYCILGRVAEVAAGKPFDKLLSLRVAQPLKLTRTTYFPAVDESNIAAGHTIQNGRLSIIRQTPHMLRKRHKLALVGGSIYAPAREAAEFARMLLHKGKAKNRKVLAITEWKEMTTIHSRRPGGGYGFGLFVSTDTKTGEVISVSHGGALYGSFCHISVDFRTKRFGVVTYTGRRTPGVNSALQTWVKSTDGTRP
ncbi:MAG: beta-lactamase family protein [Planctomycetaceae bacterium]|jgi:CubicO group peptidase (beta-lactamase class C family)|nr:beta-lactamase family protein [Planctomycetaceae bacterium]MBT6156897.1 beta-lactamase family protein [Planctomycetaceae bacterium]MBT6496109.1 beta-lactamase family protein [Planctomycetaceae bacterium]